jgi:hypothetical protein
VASPLPLPPPPPIKHAPKRNDLDEYALLVRHKNDFGYSGYPQPKLHSIVINSPLLKTVLRDVFKDFPGITITPKPLGFYPPFAPFFHCWDQLEKAVYYQADKRTWDHVKLLYGYLRTQLKDAMAAHAELTSRGLIDFEHLWTLYKPGDMMFEPRQGVNLVYMLKSARYYGTEEYRLYNRYVDWDGKMFGYSDTSFGLKYFEGTKAINELEVYPLCLHKSAEAVKQKLIARGTRFEELAGCHYKSYKGTVKGDTVLLSNDRPLKKTQNKDNRIIIDAASYLTWNDYNDESDESDYLSDYDSDDDSLISNPHLLALTENERSPSDITNIGVVSNTRAPFLPLPPLPPPHPRISFRGAKNTNLGILLNPLFDYSIRKPLQLISRSQ